VFQCVGWVERRTPPQSGSCRGPRPSAGQRTAASPSHAGSTTQAIHTCLSTSVFFASGFLFPVVPPTGFPFRGFLHLFPTFLLNFFFRFMLPVSYIRIFASTFLLPVIRFQLSHNGFQYKLPQCTLRVFSLTEQKKG
jgi:hypothetical protein